MEMISTWNGNTLGGDKPRLADDQYFTPDALALAVCRKLDSDAFLRPPAVVIEPSAGGGAFVRTARKSWPSALIHAVEPNQSVDARSGANHTHLLRWEDADPEALGLRNDDGPVLIIGNPPFSLAEEHVEIALDRLTSTRPENWEHPRYLTLVLRASFLAGQGRYQSLYKGGCLKHVWHVIGRPAFTPDGKTDAAEYAVLTWEVGHSREAFRGGWLEWKGKAGELLAVANDRRIE